MSEFTSAIGIIAALVILAAYIPYIRSTLQGKNKPNRASWFIWAALGITIAASYRLSGGIDSGWVPIAGMVGIFIIAMLSVRYGQGGHTIFDVACLIGAGIGLIAWWLTNEPAAALVISTFVDMIGSLPTIRKGYYEPESEDKLTWIMFLAGYTLNLFAITDWNFVIAFYPLEVVILSAAMVWLLVFRKRDNNGKRAKK